MGDPVDEKVDNFDLSFDEALGAIFGDEETAKKETQKEEPKQEEQKPEEQKQEEKPAEEQKPEEQKQEEKPAEEPKPDLRDAEIARLKAELEAKERTKEPAKEERKPTPAEQAQAEQEEKQQKEAAAKAEAEWVQFKKDWEEPAAMMEKMYSVIMGNVQAMIEQAFAHFTSTQLKPIIDTTNQTAQERMVSTVTAAHPDGVELVRTGQIDAWAKTLPGWKQKAVLQVLEEGNADDVIALLTEYKGTTGAVAPQKADPVVDPEVEAERQRKLKAMEAVPDRRTAPTSEADPNDFEGAFKQAIANG